MKELTIALVQLDTAVGALEKNANRIVDHAQAAARAGASLIVFPELCLSGYPPEDLVLKRHFLEDCDRSIEKLAARLPEPAVTLVGSPTLADGKAYNAAVVCARGRRLATYCKMLLPNYGVFDEKRVFTPGDKPLVLGLGEARIGLHVCEDSWFTGESSTEGLTTAALDLLVNLSASPYNRGKPSCREHVFRAVGAYLHCPVACCNLVGGQDELVFDGASLVLDREGHLAARAAAFEEEILVAHVPIAHGVAAHASKRSFEFVTADITPNAASNAAPMLPPADAPSPPVRTASVAPAPDDVAEVYAALRLGLRDYVEKNGFSRTLVALSGGIDSALVAALAVDALGKDRVTCVTMPSQYSSPETLGDAGRLAESLGVSFLTVPIRELHETFLGALSHLWEGRAPDTTEENLQARIRGMIIMALSNKFGWLVLATGNKSEMATGYCTLYGDMAGGFAVIKDVPKTLVFELCRWRNAQEGREVIPASIIERPPSAELRPDQRDTDSLPPYEELDPILERYIERDLGVTAISAEGFDRETVQRVIRLVDLNEYKRRQGPPGIKITPKAFGRDRRMPITNRYREGQ